jgi:hypothetical protein
MSQLSFFKKNIYLDVTGTITIDIGFYPPWDAQCCSSQ